jgi:putative transposase
MDTERLVKLAEMAIREITQPRQCKYCNSTHVVRFGHTKHTQRLLCRNCGRTFEDTDAIPGMRTSNEQIATALSSYYEGMSLNAIRRHLEQIYHIYPSDSTVYDWITKFSKVAIKEAEKAKPNVGDVWVADETVLKIDGKNTWFWDIIDAKTRFLLASHISTVRTSRDARKLMEKAAERAGKTPRIVLTDKLRAYLDGIELAFGSETKHIQSKPFTVQQNTNLIERFHGSLKDRTKVMRGLKSRESAKLLLDGWLVYYNFFRQHETLNKTPAEKAGIDFQFKNWLDLTKSPTVTYISVEPRTKRMKLATPRVSPMSIRPPRMEREKPLGDIYKGHGLIARHHFAGAKRHKGRVL